MNDTLLPLLYDTETTGGWTTGMTRVVLSMLNGLPLPQAPRVLEAGCGSGAFARALRARRPDALVAGLDLNALALGYATARSRPPFDLVRGNLLHLPVAAHSVDLVLALDSFDQVAIPLAGALEEARRALRAGGLLLLRVSAHPWLQGAHDVAFNTGRRYTRAEITAALERAGFRLRRITYANALLSPPVVALRLLEKLRPAPQGEPGVYSSPLANRVVEAALSLEAAWLQRTDLPFGLSLIAVAEAPA